MTRRTFLQLSNTPGFSPSENERTAYELARQHLERVAGQLPRFLSLPGSAVAVVEGVRGADGAPCVGLAVESSTRSAP